MTFKTLADLNATNDVSNLLVYVNELTDGWAMPTVLAAFFIITFLSSAFASMRFKGMYRIDFSFAAAGFATFGLAVLMSLKNGLLDPFYLLISLAVAILGAIILYISSD